MIFFEYAIDTAIACREQGVKTVAVSAGYISPEPRAEFFHWIDATNIDLKGFTEGFYRRLTGGHLQPVLDTLVYLCNQTDVWVEITTLLIPGENDSEAEIEALTEWVVDRLGPDVPLHFSAFHPDYKMLATPPTPPESLIRARRIAIRNGVRHAYLGNIHHAAGDSTYCPQCGVRLIGRDWYEITEWHLTDDGACPDCGARLAGHFDGPPGDWGRRRRPVRLQR